MMNPALEEFFGRPETVQRLAEALQQASSGLDQMRGTLDRRVTTLVPGRWQGDAASAFEGHWKKRSTSVTDAARTANLTSSALRTLASELRTAKTLFQRAEQQATANRCYITPAFVVLPYSPMDFGADAAAVWIQAEVTVALRPVGFFRELRHGAPDGPSLRESVGALPEPLRRRAGRYLDAGAVLAASPGKVDDALDPDRRAVSSPDLMTDGTWMWPRDLGYYVTEYGAGLPDEFLAAMEAAEWTAPVLSDDVALALSNEIYEQATSGQQADPPEPG
jgi:uncharacterized protein YukE